MPDRPKHSHYNHDDPGYADLPLAAFGAEGRHAIDQLRERPRVIFGTWVVRVAIVAALFWLLNVLLGPFRWVWWALLAYAVLSLAMSLLLSGLKNRQLDRIERIYDPDDARHLR